jgi:hypothetical protein
MTDPAARPSLRRSMLKSIRRTDLSGFAGRISPFDKLGVRT